MEKMNNALLTHLFHGIQMEHMIAKIKLTALHPFLKRLAELPLLNSTTCSLPC